MFHVLFDYLGKYNPFDTKRAKLFSKLCNLLYLPVKYYFG